MHRHSAITLPPPAPTGPFTAVSSAPPLALFSHTQDLYLNVGASGLRQRQFLYMPLNTAHMWRVSFVNVKNT